MTQLATDSASRCQDQSRSSKPNSPHEMLAAIKRKLQDAEHALPPDALSLSSDIIDGHPGSEDNILSRRYSVSADSDDSFVAKKLRLLSGSSLSLMDIANAQSTSASAAKRRRRSLITASSPSNGVHRVKNFNLHLQDMSPIAPSDGVTSGSNPVLRQIPIHPHLKQRGDSDNSRNILYSFRPINGRISRLPKRNLKPLDFSNIRRQRHNWKLAGSGNGDRFNTNPKKSASTAHLVTQSSPSLPVHPSTTNASLTNIPSTQYHDQRMPLASISKSAKNDHSHRRSSRILEFSVNQENDSRKFENQHPDSAIDPSSIHGTTDAKVGNGKRPVPLSAAITVSNHNI